MIVMLWAVTNAHADQCAAVSRTIAEAAVKYIPAGAPWASYCEPCGDKSPGVHTANSRAEVVTSGAGARLWSVSIDGAPVDLAYIYVPGPRNRNQLVNLASLVGCPTTGVTRTLRSPL